MGKGGKAQTVGYKYYLGMQLALCHGPIDKITKLQVDDRDAWTGSAPGGTINVSADNIFGGEGREGGVSGAVDVMMGAPDQTQNGYLKSKLGNLVPAYRGVVNLLFRGTSSGTVPGGVFGHIFAALTGAGRAFYLGNNPYLKTWKARGQRVYTRQNGVAQWNPSKAGIVSFSGSSTVALPVVLTWWQSSFHPANNDYARMKITFHNKAGDEIGSASAAMIGTQNQVWTQRTLNATQPIGTAFITIYMEMQRIEGSNNDGYIDDISLTVGGSSVAIQNPGAEDGLNGWNVASGGFGTQGTTPAPHNGTAFFTGGNAAFSSIYQQVGVGQIDLNPAHIIRECITDPDWGMGYTDEDIDDVSFSHSADVFYTEKLGMSLLWDKQVKIEDFVQNVVQHVDAVLYVSRTTGKFTLAPIRGGYDEEDLLSLDESNIQSVTDPVRVVFGELTNSVTVTYWDYTTGKDATVTVTDTALVQQQGVVINAPVQYPGFTNPINATVAAQRDLRALSSPLLSCTILADSEAKVLNIGDVFLFSWAKWGIVNMVMRVTGIAYGTGRNNRVKINCSQDVFDTDVNVVITVPPSGWEDPSAPPSPAPEQIAEETPYYELVQALGQSDTDNKLLTHPEIGYAIAAAGRPASAINASLFSDNGSGFERVGALDFCPYGYLVGAITKTQTTIVVENGDDYSEVVMGTHFQIGNELLRVDALDVDTGIMTVGRGCLDTVPQVHEAGDVLFFWDQFAGFDPTEYVEGEIVDLKITPVSGSGVLPMDAAETLTVEMTGRAARPYAPGNLRINGESYEPNAFYEGEVTISWAHRNRLEQTGGHIVDHTEGDIGPEALVKYRLQGYVDGVLVHTEDDIDGTSTTWTPELNGEVRVEVHAKRIELLSWQAPTWTFANSSFRLDTDSNVRYTEEGDARVLED